VCSSDLALYFKDNGIELKGLTNSLTYELTENEPRLYKSVNLHFSIESEKAIETQVKVAIEDAVNKYCHVCLMLQPKMLVTYTLDIIN
jgi:putative redox protein